MSDNLTDRNEIYPLTGVRAVAAIWVVLYHMESMLVRSYPDLYFVIKPVVETGYLGVDLFFILSGFIIQYNYGSRMSPITGPAFCKFLWMRLARLWPVHAAILAILVLLLWIQGFCGKAPNNPEFYTFGSLVQNLSLIHGWAIPIKNTWNTPSWSISCEWLAYIIYPLLAMPWIRNHSPRCSLAISLIIFIATALTLQMLNADGNNAYGIIRISGEFIAGSFLCGVYRNKYAYKLPWEFITPFLIVAIFIGSTYALPAFGLVAYWNIPLIGMIILGLSYDRCWISRMISTKPFLWGGYISYSFYMVHMLCITVMKSANSHTALVLIPVINLLIILALATLLFHFVEEPSRKAMRRLFAPIV